MFFKKEPKLSIELIPKSCWCSNVRDHVSTEVWNMIRKDVYKKANYRCEICNGIGDKHPVECHEIWYFFDKKLIQKLIGMIALCPKCHLAKHPGSAQMRGLADIAIKQLMKVNKWNLDDTWNYIEEKIKINNERAKFQWKLNLSWLKQNYGIIVKENR